MARTPTTAATAWHLFPIVLFLFWGKTAAQVTTLAQWTYEPLMGTLANPTPNSGSGSSAVVAGNGTITPGTSTGVSGLACGAQTSGTNAWALNPFTPGNANEINGVEFSVSTAGQSNIAVSWDQRFSNTSPNTVRLKYTTDGGGSWNDFTMTDLNTTYCLGSLVNGKFECANASGDQYRRVSVNLSEITAVNDNSGFRFRVLASYFQSTGQFRQTQTNTAVATGGTWRFDNVTVSSLGAAVPTVNLSASTNTGTEAAQTVVTLTATASSAVFGNQTVGFSVNGVGITSGDYALSASSLTIISGNTTATATFTVTDDTAIEGDESATVSLTNPTWGLMLGTTPAQNILIVDNDFAPNTPPTIAIDVAATSDYVDGAAASPLASPFGVAAAIGDPTDPMQTLGVVF